MGYTEQDVTEMLKCVREVQKFYLHYPSDLMNKEPMMRGLSKTSDLLEGLIIEGRV